jgi:looped-hinge helix DNA binding domain, AbrB family
MLTAIVAERGQVTIPKALRERLGIKPSTVLAFSVKNGALLAVKADREDPVTAAVGCLKTDRTSDEWLNELRGKCDHRR